MVRFPVVFSIAIPDLPIYASPGLGSLISGFSGWGR
jgi:hypothetical protein